MPLPFTLQFSFECLFKKIIAWFILLDRMGNNLEIRTIDLIKLLTSYFISMDSTYYIVHTIYMNLLV